MSLTRKSTKKKVYQPSRFAHFLPLNAPIMKPVNISDRFNIAGVQYGDYQRGSYATYSEYISDQTPLEVVWERSNKYDAKAIRLSINGIKLGYVPKGAAQELIHTFREQGTKVKIYLTGFHSLNPTHTMFTCQAVAFVHDCPLPQPTDVIL